MAQDQIMTEPRAPVMRILALLFAAIFLTFTAFGMLAPLLVELADEFETSVAVAGQLAAATSITWAVVAPLVGPWSDNYGRRLVVLIGVMLMALGVLGSVLAWSYGSMLGFRLLTGLGMAAIAPNCLAVAADILPPARRGKAVGWLISATGLGAALGIPGVVLLSDAGGWRLPFFVIGVLLLILWAFFWAWLPRGQRETGQATHFFSRFREIGSNGRAWYLLGANILVVAAFSGAFTYLAAYLIETYSMSAGEIALPLTLAGLGVVIGSFVGGRAAELTRRLSLVSGSLLCGGLVAALVFVTEASPWATVALCSGVGAFLVMSWPVTSVLLIELAGRSRATALGMFAFSNQAGAVVGASLGGLMLALGGFTLVGVFCLCAAATAAVVIRLKVREPVEAVQRTAA